MSDKLVAISGKDLIRLLEKLGFYFVRSKGSHFRFKHNDGRATTVPVHGNEALSKGLLRKIFREDIGITLEEFNALLDK